MNAYDYSTQTWVSGKEGTRLALKQTEQELATLTGPEGSAFAASIGITPDLFESYVQTLSAQVRRLTRELANSK